MGLNFTWIFQRWKFRNRKLKNGFKRCCLVEYYIVLGILKVKIEWNKTLPVNYPLIHLEKYARIQQYVESLRIKILLNIKCKNYHSSMIDLIIYRNLICIFIIMLTKLKPPYVKEQNLFFMGAKFCCKQDKF